MQNWEIVMDPIVLFIIQPCGLSPLEEIEGMGGSLNLIDYLLFGQWLSHGGAVWTIMGYTIRRILGVGRFGISTFQRGHDDDVLRIVND